MSSYTNCRFYEEKYPEVESFVMVNVKQIAEMGAYVKLLEYDNIDGMILLSELSRRRIRSIQKLIRVGRNEVVVVLRATSTLSKRRVSPEDIVKCEERYNKSKMVHSIMRHEVRPLAGRLQAIHHQPDVWSEIQFPNEATKAELLSYIGKRLTPQPTKVRADIEVTCFGYEGIDAVKDALRKAEAHNTADNSVKVRLVSPPLYVLTSQCLDKSAGIASLEQSIEEVTKCITGYDGGSCRVKMAPKAVTESDDAELQALMDQRERENQQVSGDEDESESDEGEIHS
ncbi:hypothetical protein GTA08_BOTSDO06230 [Botryosphaeria dothidea]|uniref:S1 motif domain-containing protein n=1 Tax=Botryosphaeria dothidea TaxID=55169 RepID=A0A8H4IRM9_9PEZI|nr:hypothetical protein GTA08_BOTSDO06230 [Botryosphaeria dothidea]